jgi:hypothetical protein
MLQICSTMLETLTSSVNSSNLCAESNRQLQFAIRPWHPGQTCKNPLKFRQLHVVNLSHLNTANIQTNCSLNPSPCYIDHNCELNSTVNSNLPYGTGILVQHVKILEISARLEWIIHGLSSLRRPCSLIYRPKCHAESNRQQPVAISVTLAC